MTQTTVFQGLNRERLYQQVADHIEGLVAKGRLRPGERLPAERELAETLEVGRGVIREAVKVLHTRGLVTVKPGLGTYVSEVDAGTFAGHLDRYLRLSHQSLNDLNELRNLIEVEIATLAAQRATPEDIAELRAAIVGMDDASVPPERYIEADEAFHLALARASGNELFPLFLDVIADRLVALRTMTVRVSGATSRAQDFHREILDAVERRDASAARAAMRDHMTQVAEVLRSAESD